VRESKSIDRLFQENLKDFEVFPPNKAWNRIERKLEAPQRKRKVPIWMKVGSVAALLALLFTVSTVYFLPENYISNSISSSDTETPVETDDPGTPVIDDTQTITELPVITNNNQQQVVELLPDATGVSGVGLEAKQLDNDPLENIAETKKSLLADMSNLPLADEEQVEEEEIGQIGRRLTFATIFAPIYLNSLGDGSGIDAQFRDNPTSGNSSYSYGVRIAYQLNNRFSVQSGVNLISLGYRTNNVYVTPGVAVLSLSNVTSNPLVGKSAQAGGSKEGVMNVIDENKGTLDQVFGYVEIPVEIKYAVTDGKLGVNLVGGFSTLLLNKDEIFIRTDDLTQSLGASNNLRSINFSGNIGLDVDYLINKNLFINVSPMLKVQTNTFSKNAGSFQPYYLGVYTGLNYKF
jgi:hypothetical protein